MRTKREAPAHWREKGSETTRGLVDLWMPVRDGLMRLAVQFVEMMSCLSVFAEPMAQGPDACHDGKGQQKNKNRPHIIAGQSLSQDAKHDNHLTDLLYGSLCCSPVSRQS